MLVVSQVSYLCSKLSLDFFIQMIVVIQEYLSHQNAIKKRKENNNSYLLRIEMI
jgi:hypothetical protein